MAPLAILKWVPIFGPVFGILKGGPTFQSQNRFRRQATKCSSGCGGLSRFVEQIELGAARLDQAGAGCDDAQKVDLACAKLFFEPLQFVG